MEEAKKLHNKPEKGGMPGVYSHPMTSSKLHATGFPQADALLRQGWEWESELPKHEELNEAPVVNVNAAAEVADLKARLAAAETALAGASTQAKLNAANEAAHNRSEATDTLERENARKELASLVNKSDEKVAEASKTLNTKESK